MAEEKMFGSGHTVASNGLARVLGGGTHGIDRAIDKAEKVVDSFGDELKAVVTSLKGIVKSTQSAHLAGSTVQSTTPTSIGGSYTFSRRAQGANLDEPGQGYTSQPLHRTDGPVKGPGNGGGPVMPGGTVPPTPHQGPSNGGGATFVRRASGVAAIGMAAFTANHFGNQKLEQSVAADASYDYNYKPTADAMFKNNTTAFNPADAAQAGFLQYRNGGYTPTSPQYATQQAGIRNTPYYDSTITQTQAAQASVSLQDPSTVNRLQVLGMNPLVNGTGNVHQLAMQILAKVPWYTRIKTAEQIAAELYDPAGGIAVTINGMVANGFIPAASSKAVVAEIGAILKAQIKGITPTQLTTLTNQARAGSDSAQETLRSAGLGGSSAQVDKFKTGASMNTDMSTLTQVTAAARQTNSLLIGVRNKLNDVLNVKIIGDAVGYPSGVLGSIGSGAIPGALAYLGWGAAKSASGGAMRLGGTVASKAGGFFSNIVSRIGNNLNPTNINFSDVPDGPTTPEGVNPGDIPGILEEAAIKAVEKAPEAGGGMALTMSRIGYGAGQVRGLPAGKNLGGQSPNNMSSGAGGGTKGGSAAASKGSAGISFIAPGPGVDSLDAETDFGPRTIGQGFHTGIDILRGMNGATIKASATGTVIGAGWGSSGDGGYGNTVMIDHGSGYVTMSAHMATISVGKGASVRQGQGIGTVGETGSYARGYHLHFELHVNGKPVDPVPYIGGRKGIYTTPAPGGTPGSVGQGAGTAGTGASMGATGSYANGSRNASQEEVDALGSLLSGSASVMSAASDGGSVSSGSTGAPAGSSKSPGQLPSHGGGSSAQNIALGKTMAAAYGWTGSQFSDLVSLWTRESNWNQFAKNPSSGAYGIPQSLPANKMATAGSDYLTNPATQEKWGLQYIKERYGSPSSAWAHETSIGWYDKGSWELKRDEIAQVHEGEMIVPSKIAEVVRSEFSKPGASRGSEGAKITFESGAITISFPGSVSPSEARTAGRQVVDAMMEHNAMKQLASGGLYG